MQTLYYKTAVLFALFALTGVAIGATGTFQRFSIDDFTDGTNDLVITIPTSPSFPIQQSSIYTDPGNPDTLLGGERDLTLAAESGPSNRVLTSNAGGGQWTVSTPNGASGFAEMQYDGKDNSVNLNPAGLGGIDFTDTGLGEAFSAVIGADIDTVYTFTVTSPNGNTCTHEETIPGTQSVASYYLPFSDFDGNCDFSNVGSLVVRVEQFENVDSLIELFAVVGQPDPSASATPTRAASIPGTPSPTRTPSPGVSPEPAVCVCDCPSFRCGVVFKQKDDDDDSVDDDTHDDDDLVYRRVYYGPVDDDFDELTGDDDEDEFISWMGGLTETGIHDDDDALFLSANDAKVVAVPVTLLLVLATFVL